MRYLSVGVHLLGEEGNFFPACSNDCEKSKLGEQVSLKGTAFQLKPKQGQPNAWDIDPMVWNPFENNLKGVRWTAEPSMLP